MGRRFGQPSPWLGLMIFPLLVQGLLHVPLHHHRSHYRGVGGAPFISSDFIGLGFGAVLVVAKPQALKPLQGVCSWEKIEVLLFGYHPGAAEGLNCVSWT